jgi:hypothetical protein
VRARKRQAPRPAFVPCSRCFGGLITDYVKRASGWVTEARSCECLKAWRLAQQELIRMPAERERRDLA